MSPGRELLGTGVVTSAIGFGCAGLFRIPQRKARMAVMHAAYDGGIRHFDTAPMYGLGLAEAELGAFLRLHRQDVTVTTKFGIDPTLLTRKFAPLQGPARAFVAKRPTVIERLKRTGKDANSGPVGRLLYSAPGYHRQAAQRSLERSLRALGTDYIDVFLLHDPRGEFLRNPFELADYLDQQCKSGRIRCWGVTGPPARLAGVLESLRWPSIIQHRDDVFSEASGETPNGARITYGALARAVPAFRQYFARTPADLALWSERLGLNLTAESALPRLLLAAALRRNTSGPVLFTTTRPERVAIATSVVADSGPSITETSAFSELIAATRAACPELAGQG